MNGRQPVVVSLSLSTLPFFSLSLKSFFKKSLDGDLKKDIKILKLPLYPPPLLKLSLLFKHRLLQGTAQTSPFVSPQGNLMCGVIAPLFPLPVSKGNIPYPAPSSTIYLSHL